jgi:hypothetical protein
MGQGEGLFWNIDINNGDYFDFEMADSFRFLD